METYELYSHPAAGALQVRRVTCEIARSRADLLALKYRVVAPRKSISIPPGNDLRRDGLWKTTCFEMFIGDIEDSGYREFNFSPGGDWAAYAFNGYREGSCNLAVSAAPSITLDASADWMELSIRISLDGLCTGMRVGLSAVIDETDFGLSYWAFRHAGERPDFHHPTCFAATLPAPDAP